MIRRLLITTAVLIVTGCTSVEPWERGNLARPEMQLDPDPLGTALQSQVHESKEASSGGTKSAGAGCGCN